MIHGFRPMILNIKVGGFSRAFAITHDSYPFHFEIDHHNLTVYARVEQIQQLVNYPTYKFKTQAM